MRLLISVHCLFKDVAISEYLVRAVQYGVNTLFDGDIKGRVFSNKVSTDRGFVDYANAFTHIYDWLVSL